MIKSGVVALALSACASISFPTPAAAQGAQSGHALPLALAVEAATTAIDACEAKGWPVSAFVVDTSLRLSQVNGPPRFIRSSCPDFELADVERARTQQRRRVRIVGLKFVAPVAMTVS